MSGEPAAEPFPWRHAMAFGLGVLKLSPAEFWAMTPSELDAALHGHFGRPYGGTVPTRAVLAALLQQYPD